MDGEQFGEMRALLHGAPSRQAWEALCALWSQPEADERADAWLPYAEKMLEGWPWQLRVAPQAWQQPVRRGRPPAAWPLVRVYKFAPGRATVADIQRMGAGGLLAPLRWITTAERQLGYGELGCLLDEASDALIWLTIHDNPLAAFGAHLIAEHPRAAQLERLEITSCQIDAEALSTLWCGPLRALRALILDHNPLSRGPSMRTLIGSPPASLLGGVLDTCMAPGTLEEVSLVGGELSHEALSAMLGDGHRRLERLLLGANQLFDVGAEALARCDLPALRRLDLSYNGLTREGVRRLCESPWARGLEALVIDGLDEDAARMIASCERLAPAIRRRFGWDG